MISLIFGCSGGGGREISTTILNFCLVFRSVILLLVATSVLTTLSNVQRPWGFAPNPSVLIQWYRLLRLFSLFGFRLGFALIFAGS